MQGVCLLRRNKTDLEFDLVPGRKFTAIVHDTACAIWLTVWRKVEGCRQTRRMPYSHALVRLPASNFGDGLTSAGDGPPDIRVALDQHRRYCHALEECGLEITELPADPQYPDSCFVEDTAIVTAHGAIATRPGAPSRAGEVGSVVAALRRHFREVAQIFAPGTVDGGDVCQTDDHFLVGISSRTNEVGARQLTRLLADLQCTSSIVDIRGSRLLHLKSGLSYLGDNRMVVTEDVPRVAAFSRYELIPVRAEEGYAANCIRANDRVLVAAGYPKFADTLAARGYVIVPIEMSEFRKMDGGLSCLSLRF
jgi:dimethylargininase